MHALPSLLALVSAGLLAAPLRRALTEGGHTRPNYRERELAMPFGVLVPLSALLALIPLLLIERLAETSIFEPAFGAVALYALGVCALGLLDDFLGSSAGLPRGWRGHLLAAGAGRFTTGIAKAVGSLGLALLAADELGLTKGRWLLAAAVLVLATNAFNLLDLRPGRAGKVFLVLGACLSIGALQVRSLWTVGLFAAPALVAAGDDLRERSMLGDTGANLIGGLAGLWLVLTLSGTGQLVALGVLVAITIYGELRSINELVTRTPWLRELDSWGRPS